MSPRRMEIPDSATVRRVAWLAVGWAALGVGAQVIFAAVMVPALGETFAFTIPGRGPTLAVGVGTTVMAVVGLAVTTAGLLLALAAVVSASTKKSSAYAIAVVVAIIVPGFVALVVGNGVAAISAGEDASGDGSLPVAVVSIVAIAAGALSIAAVCRFSSSAGSRSAPRGHPPTTAD